MINIGLVGESPNDTNSFIQLFSRIFGSKFNYFPLVNDLHGSMLDNPKTKRILRREFEINKPKYVVFIRDLDGLGDNTALKLQRRKYFSENNSVVDKKGIYFLSIFELETIIIYDLELFNELYHTKIEKPNDPMKIENSKEFLKTNTSTPFKYNDSDNPELFKILRINQVENCPFVQKFIRKMNLI